MRGFRLILSFLAVALFLLCVGSVTKGNAVDPQVGLGGGGGTCAGDFPSQTSLTQSFTVATGCVNDFINATGLTLTSLAATITSSFFGSVSCFIDISQPGNPTGNPPPFGTATATASNTCTFSGPFVPFTLDNVIPGGISGLQFGYPLLEFFPCDPTTGGACSTPLGMLDISLSATATPEPGTMLLLGMGLVTLVTSRKRLKAAKHLV